MVVVPLTFGGEINQLYVIPVPGDVPVFVKFTNEPLHTEKFVNAAETGFVLVILKDLVMEHPFPSFIVTV